MKPPDRSLSVFGATGLVLLGVLGTVLMAAMAMGIEMLRHGVTLPEAMTALQRDLLLLSLCQLGGLALALGAGITWIHGADSRVRDAIDLRPVPAAIALLAITAGFALQFPLSELVNLLSQVDPSFTPAPASQEALRRVVRVESLRDAVVVPLAVVAIPAVSEELFFRGLLQPALSRRHGVIAGVLTSSLLFGVVHAMPAAVVYASVAGLVLGLVRLRTASVLPCIALHGAFNAVPVLLPDQLVRIEGFNTLGPDVYHLPLALTVGSALVVVVCLWAMMRLTEEERG